MRHLGIIVLCFVLNAAWANAQQVTIGTPMQRMGDSFSESIGSNWGLSGKNWSFQFGGSSNAATPHFGNYEAGSGANTGVSFQGGGVNGYFRGWADQGYSNSNTMVTPSTTIMNGQQGYIGDVQERPFVVGMTPVVGNYARQRSRTEPPAYNSVLQEKMERLQYEKQAEKKAKVSGKKSVSTKKASRPTAKRNSNTAPSQVGAGLNPGTAERPARSVSEMKRRHAGK